MVAIGKIAGQSYDNQGFIPHAYEPTDTDVKFVGAMGYVSFGILLLY